MLDILSDTYRIATRLEEAVPNAGIVQERTLPRLVVMPEPVRAKASIGTPARLSLLGRMWKRWAKYRQRARDRQIALTMPEHQLRDIGLQRHELLKRIG